MKLIEILNRFINLKDYKTDTRIIYALILSLILIIVFYVLGAVNILLYLIVILTTLLYNNIINKYIENKNIIILLKLLIINWLGFIFISMISLYIFNILAALPPTPWGLGVTEHLADVQLKQEIIMQTKTEKSIVDTDWLESLSIIKKLALGFLIFKSVLISSLISIFVVFYGEWLLNKFNMETKYPALAKVIKYRRLFSRYYLIVSCLTIFIIILFEIIVCLFILSS